MSPDPAGTAARQRALRLAAAVVLGLMFEVLRGGALPMLAPIIALQLLAASPVRPPARMIVLLLGAAAGSAALAYIVAATAIGVPGLYGIGVGLLYLWGFGLAFTPRLRLIGTMMVTMTVVITSVVAASSGAALGLAIEFVFSVLEGVFLVILAHVMFPHPAGRSIESRSQSDDDNSSLSVATRAVLATLVMVPLHLYLTSDGLAAMVILLTTATMLRQPGIAQSTRYSLVYAAGNAFGGVLAGISAFIMAIHGELVMLAGVVTATSLVLATLVVRSERLAPALMPGFVAYTALFGLTLSSLPLGYEIDVVKRVLQILTATAYALGAVSLLVPFLGWLERIFGARRIA